MKPYSTVYNLAVIILFVIILKCFLNLCHKTITRVCKKCSQAERISILQSDNMPTVRKKFSKTVRIIRMDGKYRSWR